MAKGAAFSGQLLGLIFQGVAIAGIAQNDPSPLTQLYIALHTADPSPGTQATAELSYTGYARQPVARSTLGFVLTGASISPAANIVFPISSGGAGGTVTNWSIGVASSGTTAILYSGSLNVTFTVTSGVEPILASQSTVTES